MSIYDTLNTASRFAAPPLAVAEQNRHLMRTGKAHRIASGRAPASPRSPRRRRYRVACGLTLRLALPIAWIPPGDLCRKCFPEANR